MLTSGEVTWRRSSPSGPCAAEGPQQSSVLTDETPGSVQIGDKGLEQSRTGEKKPHDSNVSFPGVATSGLLCHRFGHLHPPAPLQCGHVRARESVRACSYASSRRRAFLGERKRWAVSCQLAYSSAGMRTARPLLETISMAWWLAAMRSMSAGNVRLASSALTVTATPLVSHGIGTSYRPLRLGWWQELP